MIRRSHRFAHIDARLPHPCLARFWRDRVGTFLLLTSLVVLCAPAAVAQAAAPAKKPATSGAKPAQAAPGVPTTYKQIPIPKLPEFHPQEPKKIVLSNGMTIFLQVDHELPLISGSMRIRGGSISEPAAKTGLVSVYGDVWRTGGTTTRTGDQLDDFLASRAAVVETGGGADSTTIGFNCLKERLDEVFPIFLELLRQPAFRDEKIALAKVQMNTEISRRNDDPGSIVSRESTRIAYGPDNPYARIPEYATVAAITRDDLVKWHQTFIHPNNIILGISGDFDPAAMEQRLRQAFDSWEKAAVPPKPEIQFRDPKPAVYFVDKSDVNQSNIRMVTLGIQRNNPDYFPVEVMNEVLGGGFTSRLVKSIRTEKGLAYSVGGGIGAAFDHPGIFRLGMGTKSENTVTAVQALKDELRNLNTNPITEAELKDAKDAILNRFIFHFDSKEKVLGERMLYEFYGYPADFLERYRAGIEKANVDDVNRVAKKYVHPEQFAVVVVGNQSEFGKPLSALGPVTPVDISIPEPGATAAGGPAAAAGEQATAAPKQSDPKARALLEKFVNFLGGAAKVDAVKALHQTSVSAQNTGPATISFNVDTTIVFPDRIRAVAHAEQMPGEMVVVASPQTAFMTMGDAGTREMPQSMKQDRLNNIRRDYLLIAQHLNDPKYVFALGGTEKIADIEAQVVDISGDGISVRWTLDPRTGRLLRALYKAIGGAGPAQRVVDYSDWRPVEGLNLTFKRAITENGQPVASEEIKTIQINPPVNPKLFDKPAS
jgi:zinc protease